MSEQPTGANDADAPESDEDAPIYRAQPTPEAVPGFLERALEHLRSDPGDDDFTFEDVDFEVAAGVWLAPIGAYDPEQDTPATEDVAAGTSPTGAWGPVMLDWERAVRRALAGAWGDPVVHTPRLVGSEREPEGILDYLMVAQEFEEAELWDRGEFFVALVTHWPGDPGASYLSQIAIVLPRTYVMGGMSALLSEDDTTHELLMYGEAPLEVRRRAWLMSAAYGAGEVRLREVPIEATRCSLERRDGTTTVWTFADDGRALLLVQDPACGFARAAADAAEESGEEAELILIRRLLDGVPEDLRACIGARGETARGDIAENALQFRLLGEEPVPIITGAFWFDGQVWHTSRGLMELGHQNGFGMDDYGFGEAVRRPYRLGGSLTIDEFAPPDDDARRSWLTQLFDACPYPEQPRPEGDVRLGYGIPSSADREGIVDQVMRATEAWWERSAAESRLGDDTFAIAGRRLRGDEDDGVLYAILAAAESWTVDALREWTNRLGDAMTKRWGSASLMHVHDPVTEAERRTPLTRVMRGTGLTVCPMWWVNGHAVVLLAGQPNPSYSTVPQAILAIGRADTLRELLGRMSLWEVRQRARVIANLTAMVGSQPGRAEPEPAVRTVDWDGPPLDSSSLVPAASRGELRTGTFSWVWHFTHDGRGLLVSYEIDGGSADVAEQVDLFAGVPEDLRSLVGADERAGAAAVFFHNGTDWRASSGMLRRAHATSSADGSDPLEALYSPATGVPQLRWALRAGAGMSPHTLADPEVGRVLFGRTVDLDEARAAFDQLPAPWEAALSGTLNDLLDVIADRAGHRSLLDAALSNPDPRHRREISLWLLGEGVDASVQLSFMTPINVLLANPTLGAGDAVVLERLLASGADATHGLLGPRPGGDPLEQLRAFDADEELQPLVDVLRAHEGVRP